MKTLLYPWLAGFLFCSSSAWAQAPGYTNFIRQIQYPSMVQWDASVSAMGQQQSALAINPGGARFELWTVNSTGPSSFLLDSCYVGTYVPLATLAIRTEDVSATIPRTRADRPFYLDVSVSGLLSGEDDPEASKSVKFLRHVQSYGVDGTGIGIDRTQATLLTQSSIETNGVQNLTFVLNSVPGANRAKVRGEERFAIFSLEDYQAPESQIAAQMIQIWPVADGTITGITAGEVIRYQLPQVTITVNDLYPNSTTYAQVYKGDPRLGASGTIVTGSGVAVNDSVPQNRVMILNNYDEVFDSDGRWTMELVTITPFGMDRLAHVTFIIDRTIAINGSFTTIE